MGLKEIAVLITTICAILLIVQVLAWVVSTTVNPSSENMDKAGELIAQAAIPWWISVMQWLSQLPGALSTLLLLAFIWFLFRSGTFNG